MAIVLLLFSCRTFSAYYVVPIATFDTSISKQNSEIIREVFLNKVNIASFYRENISFHFVENLLCVGSR